ncbi:MAG: hypothetical protein R3C14_39195 [Caldilineaceae bacterium]
MIATRAPHAIGRTWRYTLNDHWIEIPLSKATVCRYRKASITEKLV